MGDPVKHLALLRAIREYPMSVQEKAVLLSLCSYGDENGKSVFPSQKTLAELNEMSVRGMRMIFRQIKEKRFIIGDGWHNRCKLWRINTELFLAGPANEKPARKKVEKPKPVVPPVAAPPVVEGPPPLTPEQIAKRHADKAKVLEKLGRR